MKKSHQEWNQMLNFLNFVQTLSKIAPEAAIVENSRIASPLVRQKHRDPEHEAGCSVRNEPSPQQEMSQHSTLYALIEITKY